MQIEKYYKAQDIIRLKNLIESVMSRDEIDDKSLSQLDVDLQRSLKGKIADVVKKELKKKLSQLDKEFNDL